MEVFDRFIPYFLFVMHIHPCIYIIPIFMRMAYVMSVASIVELTLTRSLRLL